MSFWNSLDSLHKINNTLIVSWVVISAIFGLISWKIQARITDLESVNETNLKDEIKSAKDKSVTLEEELRKSEASLSDTENKLRAEITKTNKKITPRTLSQEEFTSLVSVLSKHQGRNFVVKVMSEDFEGQDFANIFAQALVGAGWKLAQIMQHGGWRFDDGIKIIVQSNTKEIEALCKLLSNSNLNPQIEESAQDDFVRIFIGKLPK